MDLKVDIDEGGFKGTATVEIRKYSERIKMLKGLNLKVNADGEVEDQGDALEQTIKMQELAYQYVKEVKLKHDSGLKIDSLEVLEMYEEGEELIQVLVGYVLRGVKLGKE